VTYQRITTDRQGVLNGDTFEYVAPVGRRQFLSLSGQRTRARPVFLDGLFAQDGRSSSLEVRWHGPLQLRGRPFDASAGLSHKASNNNLEYGGQQVLASTSAVIQAAFSLSTVLRDTRGAWGFSATGTLSPGNLSDRNSDAVFNEIRAGAKSSYLVGQLMVQRFQRIGARGEVLARATLQRATSNLLASEQLSVGGSGSVRGYRENAVAGDRGVLLGFEASHPLAAFYEAASVGPFRATSLDLPARPLAAAGLSLRLRAAERVSAQLDYGWQLLRVIRGDSSGRLHVRVSGSF
jgi:hemolysin activation/secretion protein